MQANLCPDREEQKDNAGVSHNFECNCNLMLHVSRLDFYCGFLFFHATNICIQRPAVSGPDKIKFRFYFNARECRYTGLTTYMVCGNINHYHTIGWHLWGWDKFICLKNNIFANIFTSFTTNFKIFVLTKPLGVIKARDLGRFLVFLRKFMKFL